MKKIPVLTYTRTVGYFSNTASMNPGKRQEVSERKMCDISKMGLDNELKNVNP